MLLSLAQTLERADQRAEAPQVAIKVKVYTPAGYEDLTVLLQWLQPV